MKVPESVPETARIRPACFPNRFLCARDFRAAIVHPPNLFVCGSVLPAPVRPRPKKVRCAPPRAAATDFLHRLFVRPHATAIFPILLRPLRSRRAGRFFLQGRGFRFVCQKAKRAAFRIFSRLFPLRFHIPECARPPRTGKSLFEPLQIAHHFFKHARKVVPFFFQTLRSTRKAFNRKKF